MKCRLARRQLSLGRDATLGPAERRVLESHLAQCAACREVGESLNRTIDLLAGLPRIEGSVASDVLARLEVEQRGPGLALLFRPRLAARPLILPSLLPAAAVVLAILFGSLSLSGSTPSQFFFPLASPEVRDRSGEVGPLTQMGEGTLFLETLVGPDGKVTFVRVIDGDSDGAGAVVDAFRKEHFEPVLLSGRPVSVGLYRLISRVDVVAPST